ncbi:MAG: hypothetical protein WD749_04485 [Phycisphaerales bacterium]
MGVGRSMIISDGGTAALLAAAAAADRGARSAAQHPPAVLWPFDIGGDTRVPSHGAVGRQAELFGLSEVAPAESPAIPAAPARGPEALSCMLLRAGYAAAAAGAETVVWPVSAGPELDLALTARAIDRALLTSRLVALDLGAAAPEFRTPYVDFTDAQVADLVLDMDLPVWLCWWWEGGTSAAAAERDRWMTALRTAGGGAGGGPRAGDRDSAGPAVGEPD